MTRHSAVWKRAAFAGMTEIAVSIELTERLQAYLDARRPALQHPEPIEPDPVFA